MKPLGVVVTTIGRTTSLLALLRSLAPDRDVLAVSIAVQGGQPDLVELLLAEGGRLGLDLVVDRSSGGASAGRNDAVRWLGGRCRVLAFPNDTTVFPRSTVRSIVDATADPGFRAGAVRVDDPSGPKFELPDATTPLDRRNVWSVILPGLLMREDVFTALGGFDATIGTGARTPWQSGEETAILLRYLEQCSSEFTWLPSLVVVNPHDTAGLDAAGRRRKLLGYARGYGRLLRTERYGFVWFARSLLAGATFGLRHGAPYGPLDGWWVLRGRFEGWLGRVLGADAKTAITMPTSDPSTRHAPGKVGRPPNGGA